MTFDKMTVDQTLSILGQGFRVAAMGLAAAAVLKMSGFVSIRFAVTELAAVAIACALAK